MIRETLAENFIGREKEIASFKHWLEKNTSQVPNILFLYSAPNNPKEQGGLGKTWLLRRFADIVEQQGDTVVVWIDFLNVADRDAVTIAQRTVRQLRARYSAWIPANFDHALNKYENFLHQPAIGIHQDYLADIRLALQQDLQVLSAHFTDTRKKLVIFFDTLETIEKDLLQFTLDNTSSFPDTYGFSYIGFVIAGRHAPDWDNANWAGRKSEVQTMPISPFTQQEMLDYYNKQLPSWYYPQITENAQHLHELTRGRPILVSLIADLLSDEAALPSTTLLDIAPQDVEKQLVLRINDLTQSVNLVVLSMAHISHRFNRDLFIKILADHSLEVDLLKVWHRLLKLSFVRLTSNHVDITLHDEMRDLVNKYNWPEVEKEKTQGPKRRDLSLTVIDYYQQAIETVSDPHIRQAYFVEQLYHKLFVDPQKYWATFEELFQQAIRTWQMAYARNLLREAKKFTSDFSEDQVAKLLLHEIRLLRREERYQESLELCEQFPNKVAPNWLAQNTNTFLFQKGEAYRFASRLDDALSCFEQILYLDAVRPIPQVMYAEVLSRIGNIYEQRAAFDKAANFYEKSLNIFKAQDIMRYVDVINHLCLVYCSQGRAEEALWRCMIALNICREMQKPGETFIMLPDSLNTVGIVYIYLKDFDKAYQHIEEAKEIFEHLQNKKGIARAYYSLGHCEMEKGKYANAKLWFECAYLASRTVDDTSIEIESLHKQAQVNIQLGYGQEAIDDLNKAITRAQQIHNSYREVELLLELAAVLDTTGDRQASASMYQQANAAAKQEKYYYRLLGCAELRQAQARYYTQEYEQAFLNFGKYCYCMSQLGQKDYKQAISETLEHLLALTGDKLSNAWRTLDTFWREHSPKYGEKEVEGMQTALDEARLLVNIIERRT